MADKGDRAGISEAAGASGSKAGDLASAGSRVLEKRQTGGGGSSGSADAGGEAVVDMMKRLNLTSREADPLILDDEGDVDPPGPEWALIGKVLAPNTLHVDTIRAVVRPAWGNPKGLAVRPMGNNLFLAEFVCEADKSRIAKGGPWHLGRHAILLKDYDVKLQPEEVVFNEIPVWARILNLGYELMNVERGSALAARLGVVDRVDVDENGRAWGSFLRARVTIDASQPIMRYASAYSKKRDKTVHYQVMYENLPLYCFSCGMLGHSSVVCPTPADRDADGKLPYNGEKLCVPEKKKESFSSADHSRSSKSSWNGTDQGSGSRVPAPTGKKKGDGKDVMSPLKETPRTRKTSVTRQGTNLNFENDAGKGAANSAGDRVSGFKRKQTRQVYQPKIPVLEPVDYSGVRTLVLVGEHLKPEVSADASTNLGHEASDDSNKKQRTNSSRSADQAGAVEQPRQTQ
jgi:hypothetical protein